MKAPTGDCKCIVDNSGERDTMEGCEVHHLGLVIDDIIMQIHKKNTAESAFSGVKITVDHEYSILDPFSYQQNLVI